MLRTKFIFMKAAKQALNTNKQWSSGQKIFRTNLNNKFKLTPFNTKLNDTGEVKYLPPVSKEWKNTIYSYYKNNMQNLPINSINANKVIQSYFNLHFADNKFIGSKLISPKKRSLFLKKIYVSKMETKHTSSKTIITLYTINPGKNVVYEQYKNLAFLLENQVLNSFKKGLYKKIKGVGAISYPSDQECSLDPEGLLAKINNITIPVSPKGSGSEAQKKLLSKYKYLTESLQGFNLYLRLCLGIHFKKSYFDKLDLLRKYQFNYYLNKFKFERNTYLHKLSNILSRIFNNNIEFNIINLKSVAFNPDIFTEILSLKLRKPKSGNALSVMNSLLKVAQLPEINKIQEKASIIKSKNESLLENSYPNLSLVSILNKNKNKGNSCSLNSLLNERYSLEAPISGGYDLFSLNEKKLKTAGVLRKELLLLEDSILDIEREGSSNLSPLGIAKHPEPLATGDSEAHNISNRIFNSIKYKNLGGIRLEVKGRLTKRNRADRSQFKFKWKGGLKDIDSSYKKLSTVTYRGYYKPNVIYSLSQSKRRVGSFAVKGWISGK